MHTVTKPGLRLFGERLTPDERYVVLSKAEREQLERAAALLDRLRNTLHDRYREAEDGHPQAGDIADGDHWNVALAASSLTELTAWTLEDPGHFAVPCEERG